MRHRMGCANSTGLGNASPALLNNNGVLDSIIKKILKEAIELYFKKWEGCDYQIDQDKVLLGIEPAYQYENLKIICISKTKENSYIETGTAWEAYGSGIAKKRKYYGEYKNRSKFIKCIDKWHPKLFIK